jgi:hypothetical protein
LYFSNIPVRENRDIFKLISTTLKYNGYGQEEGKEKDEHHLQVAQEERPRRHEAAHDRMRGRRGHQRNSAGATAKERI